MCTVSWSRNDRGYHLLVNRDEKRTRGAAFAPQVMERGGVRYIAPIDRDFGHFRRYDAPDLRRKLTRAGFQIVGLHHFNGLGYLLWWLEFTVLKRRHFARRKVWLFDRLVFPILHAVESRVCRPPRGQSILAVARAHRASSPAAQGGLMNLHG